MSSIEDRVKKITSERLGADISECTNSASFIVDLGANPEENEDLDELYLELAEEFEVEFPEDAAEKITTVGAAIDYLKQQGAR
ncbi:acyl carrier protein [Streptomyces halobius]|uniref:Acyl carrier protein n=1 Tax=Streptomyces halobius TaxID=2879846 RepID=A0ABY4MFQ4_9ACTN|nr:acyl carrier protein [Streptomyces halobius]UQA96621.1 acyl carrier protein [Streptomyces halobius]